MTFRVLTMVDVTEILRRWQASQSMRCIARETCVDRKTVQRYINEAVSLGLPRDRPLSDEEIQRLGQRVQARSSPPPSDAWLALVARKEWIREQLNDGEPLTLSQIFSLLQHEGVKTSYATLRRFAIAELGWRKSEARARSTASSPGVGALVDFGPVGELFEPQVACARPLFALVVTLCYSRYQFVWPLVEESTEAVCEGLDEAWKFFGGIPKKVLPTDIDAIIDSTEPDTPRVVVAFTDYAQARGIFVDPSRVRQKRQGALVECEVPRVRERWCQGCAFGGLDEARESARGFCRELGSETAQVGPRSAPREIYERVEKRLMAPPPTAPFDVPAWGHATVGTDHHAAFMGARYSVPSRYVSKNVLIRADKSEVRIYRGLELIQTHRRKPPERQASPSDTQLEPQVSSYNRT